jgi:hypothetical protein
MHFLSLEADQHFIKHSMWMKRFNDSSLAIQSVLRTIFYCVSWLDMFEFFIQTFCCYHWLLSMYSLDICKLLQHDFDFI